MKGAQKQGEGRGAGSRRSSSKSRVATHVWSGESYQVEPSCVHVVYLFSFRTWSERARDEIYWV